MSTKKKETKKDNSFLITEIDDFYCVLTDEEVKSLYGFHDMEANFSVFRNGVYIPIYIINNIYLMRYSCEFGEWFVLGKPLENTFFDYLSKFDKVCSILFSDEKTVERLENFYNEQHTGDEEIYL